MWCPSVLSNLSCSPQRILMARATLGRYLPRHLVTLSGGRTREPGSSAASLPTLALLRRRAPCHRGHPRDHVPPLLSFPLAPFILLISDFEVSITLITLFQIALIRYSSPCKTNNKTLATTPTAVGKHSRLTSENEKPVFYWANVSPNDAWAWSLGSRRKGRAHSVEPKP